MSRLRRLLVSEKIFFITCNLLSNRLHLVDNDFVGLAEAISGVRRRRTFVLAGYVFMPDHWHALIAPARDDTLPHVMNAVKVAAARRINSGRGTLRNLWQPRYFDEIIRTVAQYHESMRYMHSNPVEKGLVTKPEAWPWSSYHNFDGTGVVRMEIDHVELPADGNFRL